MQLPLGFAKNQCQLSNYSLSHEDSDDGNYWSSSVEQIKNAACRRPMLEGSELIGQLESLQKNSPLISQKILGINFINQNETLLNNFKQLVITDDEFIQVPEIDSVILLRAANCNSVICAVKAIFGEKVGPKILFLKAKYGFNASHLVHENSFLVTEREINAMISAVAQYPDFIFPLVENKNNKMTKFTPNETLELYEYDTQETLANATISLFDGWSSLSSEMMEYIVFHEIAHKLGRYLNLDHSVYWSAISKCQDGSKECYVSTYAAKDQFEDFAESVTAYRYNSQALKKASAAKYKFIRETVFRNHEFINKENCQQTKLWDVGIAKSLISGDSINNFISSTTEHAPLSFAFCPNELITYLLSPSKLSSDDMYNCYLKYQVSAHIPGYFLKLLDPTTHDEDYRLLIESALIRTNGIELVIDELKQSSISTDEKLKIKFLNWQETLLDQINKKILIDLSVMSNRKNYLYQTSLRDAKYRSNEEFCVNWASYGENEKKYGNQVFSEVITEFTHQSLLSNTKRHSLSKLLYDVCLNLMKQRTTEQKWSAPIYSELREAWFQR